MARSRKPSEVGKDWTTKIDKSEKFLDTVHTHGEAVYARYEDDRASQNQLNAGKKVNIFYSNVNTLKESLFNSLPKPDVRKMHRGAYNDDVSRVACLLASRVLAYEVECAPHFEESVSYAILDRLVPGIGQVWLSFGVDKDPNGEPKMGSEKITIEHLFWKDFIYEPARRWSKVSWVGRIHHMSKKGFEKRFPGKFSELADTRATSSSLGDADNIILKDKIKVYEIWNRPDKKVYWIYKGMDEPLEVQDDPLQLSKFFPCPKPLIANTTTKKFLPVTDYHLAQDQYNTLDELYARICLITEAIKVAGAYDSSSGDLSRILSEGENKLIPVDNWAMFAEKGGMKGIIDWYPVDQIVTVLQHLQNQFEATKAVLYEVTGMSDIIRGASNQYETAAAQQIKAQFASVRMGGYQRDVSIFVRDILRIISDMAFGGLYSQEKLKMEIGEIDEPDLQYLQPAMAVLTNDMLVKYKVDIQANSLTQADWALEKQERQELAQTMGNMIQQIMGLAADVPEMNMLAIQMVKFLISGYKGAYEFEGWLDQQLDKVARKAIEDEKTGNDQKPPSPEEQKMQMEQQKMQGEMQMKQMDAQLKQQESQQKMQLEQQKMQLEVQKQQMELEHQQQMNAMDIQMKQLELQMKREEQQLNLQGKVQDAALQRETSAIQAQMGIEQSAQSFAQKQQQGDQAFRQKQQQAKQQVKTNGRSKDSRGN